MEEREREREREKERDSHSPPNLSGAPQTSPEHPRASQSFLDTRAKTYKKQRKTIKTKDPNNYLGKN